MQPGTLFTQSHRTCDFGAHHPPSSGDTSSLYKCTIKMRCSRGAASPRNSVARRASYPLVTLPGDNNNNVPLIRLQMSATNERTSGIKGQKKRARRLLQGPPFGVRCTLRRHRRYKVSFCARGGQHPQQRGLPSLPPPSSLPSSLPSSCRVTLISCSPGRKYRCQ